MLLQNFQQNIRGTQKIHKLLKGTKKRNKAFKIFILSFLFAFFSHLVCSVILFFFRFIYMVIRIILTRMVHIFAFIIIENYLYG